MPLFVSAAGCASRTDEVAPLLCGNGGAEDTTSGDDLVVDIPPSKQSTPVPRGIGGAPFGGVSLETDDTY